MPTSCKLLIWTTLGRRPGRHEIPWKTLGSAAAVTIRVSAPAYRVRIGMHRLTMPLIMTNKRLREIAALEVEIQMTEAHVKKLSSSAPNVTDSEGQNQMAALLKEETTGLKS